MNYKFSINTVCHATLYLLKSITVEIKYFKHVVFTSKKNIVTSLRLNDKIYKKFSINFKSCSRSKSALQAKLGLYFVI